MFVLTTVEAVSSQNNKWATRAFLVTTMYCRALTTVLNSGTVCRDNLLSWSWSTTPRTDQTFKDSQGSKMKISVLMNRENKFYNFYLPGFSAMCTLQGPCSALSVTAAYKLKSHTSLVTRLPQAGTIESSSVVPKWFLWSCTTAWLAEFVQQS